MWLSLIESKVLKFNVESRRSSSRKFEVRSSEFEVWSSEFGVRGLWVCGGLDCFLRLRQG